MIRSPIKPLRIRCLIKTQNFQQLNLNCNQRIVNQSLLLPNKNFIRGKIPNYGYFTLVDKPIQSATLNSVIQLGAEFMHFSFTQWSWPAEASIFIGAIAYRLLVQLLSKFIQDFKYKNHENRSFYKLIHKVFLIDLNREIKFYNLNSSVSNQLHKYYRVSYLLKNAFTFYLNLNFLRGAHYILTNQHFFSFHLHTSIFPSLASYDPTFILPLIPMGLTFLWISSSRHPFLINLIRPQNNLFRMNLAFMTGLIFVPLPAIYAIGYSGLLSGHLLIRKFYHQTSDIKQDWKLIFKTTPKSLEQDRKQPQKIMKNSQKIEQQGTDKKSKQ